MSEDLEEKYLKFLDNTENVFDKTDTSAEAMIGRIYCGLRFAEGSIKAMKIFKTLKGKELMDENGKRFLVEWLEEMTDNLR